MKKECDFSQAERGKFYDPKAELALPIYLDPKSAAFLQELAAKKRVPVADIVNDWIKKKTSHWWKRPSSNPSRDGRGPACESIDVPLLRSLRRSSVERREGVDGRVDPTSHGKTRVPSAGVMSVVSGTGSRSCDSSTPSLPTGRSANSSANSLRFAHGDNDTVAAAPLPWFTPSTPAASSPNATATPSSSEPAGREFRTWTGRDGRTAKFRFWPD